MLYRMAALQIARREIGVREQPRNSNWGPRVSEYLAAAGWKRPAPWCMAFIVWCFAKAGLKLNYKNLASVGFFETWARRNGYLVVTPQPGDLVCYRFDADNWPDHVGIVAAVSADGRAVDVVEGNTAKGNDANGGMVMLRHRLIGRCSFARVPGKQPVIRLRKKPVEKVLYDVDGPKGGPILRGVRWEAIKPKLDEYRRRFGGFTVRRRKP